MERHIDNRRWKCRTCAKITLEPLLLTAPSPFDDSVELIACPKCKQCDDGFDLVCDEPGCDAVVVSGWPTGVEADKWGGYRNTCATHMVSDGRIVDSTPHEPARVLTRAEKVTTRFMPWPMARIFWARWWIRPWALDRHEVLTCWRKLGAL